LLQAAAYILVFLACVIVLAKLRSPTVRQAVLLVASVGLYLTWVPWFAGVLLVSIVMNFLVGRWLRKRATGLPLTIGVFLNLALLGIFKYLPEAATAVSLPALQPFAKLALPLGISFWTFQALSYLFDLYQGEELDPSIAEFALYMAFFPVTISGPVCRLPDMLPQFRAESGTSWNEIGEGFRRIAVGVLMIQLAKLLGQGILAGDGIVSGFDRATGWGGADVWCLAFGYGLQLFFDFAGYSHIAIGAARALGFTIPENFARPFASVSPSMFWTRWHMSLSFWIRDYAFFPLMQLRRETWWRNLALLISMILFGLWHRASLLFLLWGAYHGILLIFHRQIEAAQRRFDWSPPAGPWSLLSWITTISLMSLGWIFFRANSWSQARQMLSAIVSPETYGSHHLSASLYLLVAALAAGYAFVMLVCTRLDRYAASESETGQAPSGMFAFLARWRWFWIPAVYGLALLFVLMITLTQEGGVGQLMYRSF
jgi:alginate O-acetyltransferase complex protein AlgI